MVQSATRTKFITKSTDWQLWVVQPALGSEIDFPQATFRPRLVDLWADDPAPPPQVATSVPDAGSATGTRQSGPVLSASAEGRQAILNHPAFVLSLIHI